MEARRRMNHEKRLEIMRKFLDTEVLPTLAAKNVEYSQGDDDANANFKRLAMQLSERGIDKFDVLFIYMTKHWDALVHWFKRRKTVSNETLRGRIVDIIGYLLILIALLEEDGKLGGKKEKKRKEIFTTVEGKLTTDPKLAVKGRWVTRGSE